MTLRSGRRGRLLQIPQQKIDIEASLVGLINDQRIVGTEVAVMGQLSQQNTVVMSLIALASDTVSLNRI
ncbi:MAG: hypothetical protein CM15mP74_05020 [Halieaceae bacterium]|nr:MAG: hypothetical protein CM15mP74_05020 [Halieaceae bacterium]